MLATTGRRQGVMKHQIATRLVGILFSFIGAVISSCFIFGVLVMAAIVGIVATGRDVDSVGVKALLIFGGVTLVFWLVEYFIFFGLPTKFIEKEKDDEPEE